MLFEQAHLKNHTATTGWVALICVLAFLLRYFYIVSLDHLLCQFGDAYCFLAGASKLREFVCTTLQTGNYNLIGALPPASANGMLALRSIAVSDRLMVDGPIFPSYLALVQSLVGLAPGSLLFDSRAIQISIVNALLDTFTCLLVFAGTRAAFGRRAGYFAATIFAVYPASIINTQSCYTEPFGCFVLALWSWLVLVVFSRQGAEKTEPSALPGNLVYAISVYGILGIVTGILTLTRPPFLFLPIGFGLLLAALRLWQREPGARLNLRLLHPALSFLAGLFIVFLPWLALTHQVTGHYSLAVNRVPAFNLYLGNQLHRDGWRAYPFPADIPESVTAATKQILQQAAADPGRFLSMELRKIPRLWVGTWNEFQYAIFGLPVFLQEIFHQVLISLAVVGLLLLLTKRQTLREKDAAVSLLVAIFAVQNLYLAFEPISRYTMTATPAIFMLAAYLISQLSAKPKVLAAFLVTLIALVAAMQLDREVIACCAILIGQAAISIGAPAVFVIILTVGYFCLLKILKVSGLASSSLNLALGAAFCCLAVLTFVCLTGNPEMTEWKVCLSSPEQSIRQEIVLPPPGKDVDQAADQYLLLDLDQGQCPAPLNISVNGTAFSATAVPWLQLQPNLDFLEVLTLQEKAMGVSLYSYRHWWVVPVAPGLLKYGETNTVTIAPGTNLPLTIFGDFADHEQSVLSLPSLKLSSWTKAFCTYDHYDPRIYEAVSAAKVHSSFKARGGWVSDDLSGDAGKQFGQYRIHVITLSNSGVKEIGLAGAQVAPAPTAGIVVSMPDEKIVTGANPNSMQLATAQINVAPPAQAVHPYTSGQPAALDFILKCQLSSGGSPGSAFIAVEFQGKDADGSTKKWTSIWQPASIQTNKNWTPFYLCDSLPDDILGLHDLKACITVCPFHPDHLFLHHNQAIKSKVLVKELSLTLNAGRRILKSPLIKIY